MSLSKKKHKKKTIKKQGIHNHTKKFKKLNCSPGQDLNYSCFSPDQLIEFKKQWNVSHPSKKIKSNSLKIIWKKLQENLSNKCNNEKCWLDQEFLRNTPTDYLRKTSFAPNAPESWKNNPDEWLSSTDITKIMRQYENEYPEFKFIGPSPIDFDKKKHFGNCVWNELCNFSLKDYLDKKINVIGIVWNTDPHNEPGEHWICMVINIKEEYIYFFDSNADSTPPEIKKFQHKVKLQGKPLGINFKIKNNKKRHQYEDSQCGMYCIYIITTLLKTPDHPLEFKHRISDKFMKMMRKIYFN